MLDTAFEGLSPGYKILKVVAHHALRMDSYVALNCRFQIHETSHRSLPTIQEAIISKFGLVNEDQSPIVWTYIVVGTIYALI